MSTNSEIFCHFRVCHNHVLPVTLSRISLLANSFRRRGIPLSLYHLAISRTLLQLTISFNYVNHGAFCTLNTGTLLFCPRADRLRDSDHGLSITGVSLWLSTPVPLFCLPLSHSHYKFSSRFSRCSGRYRLAAVLCAPCIGTIAVRLHSSSCSPGRLYVVRS